MKNSALILIFSLLIYGCESKQKEEKGLVKSTSITSEQVIGQWSNLSLQIIIDKEPEDSVVSVPDGKWEEVLKIKPIITKFEENGYYTSEYYALDNRLMMTSAGVWEISGDSLVLIENETRNAYKMTINDDIATFVGYLDWDEDGENDDLYTGTQKKELKDEE